MKKTLLVLALLVLTLAANAIPAKPGLKKTITLADGTQIVATLVGDEHGHFYRGSDGKAYNLATGETYYQEIDAEVVKASAKARRAKANQRRANRLKAPAKKVGTIGNYTGQKKGLIILAQFTDTKFQASNNLALYKRIANEEGLKVGNFDGSVHDYFTSQSDSQFDLTFDVVGPVTVSKAASYYGGNDNHGDDKYPATMVIEALKLVDSQVNFSDYDWDGDGEVDQVMVIYAGAGEANGGAEDTIWPHEWELSAGSGAQTMDGMKIDTYAVSCELQPDTWDSSYTSVTSWKIDGLGTICHEFSHCLGYPDFYDTDYSGGFGMDVFDLMCSGSYNNDGYTPAGYTSYERWVAGWKTPIELSSATEVTQMKALTDGGNSYVIYNDGHKDEYFLLENRQQTSWDKYLPGNGLLILHVDYDAAVWAQNAPNDDPSHQRMTWVQADNELQYDEELYQFYLEYRDEEVYQLTDAGLATDFYPISSNNAFGNATTPAAKLFNANTDGKKYLNKQVYDITRNGNTISFKFALDENEGATGTYTKVTSASELAAGDQIIILNEASAKALSTTQNPNNRAAVAIDVADDVADPSSDVQVITLEGAAGAWYLKVDDGYLGCVNGTKNLLRTLTSKTDYAKAAITISGGDAEIKFASGERNIVRYNSSSDLFSCYKSGQQVVQVYKKTTATGINSISNDVQQAKQGVYTINGVQLKNAENLPKGIYIIGGKKVVVR